MRQLLAGLAGLVGGAVAGLVVTLGLVVARARVQGAYFHDLAEVVGWVGLPLLIGPAMGLWIGLSHPPGRSILPASALGLAAGVALGAAAGALGEDPSSRWAGLVMGGAAGLLVGAWIALVRHFRRRARARTEGIELGPRRTLAAGVLLAAAFLAPLAVLVVRINQAEPPGAARVAPGPDSVEVAAVVLLLGDAGKARRHLSPVLQRVHGEVERWSARLEGDSSVVVLLLGDIVYPRGLAEPGSPTWSGDSAHVADQAWLVAGDAARAHGARALFVAGNHDWGDRRDYEGAVRLARLDSLLARLSAAGPGGGPAVDLLPPAGTGGPAVVDLGAHLRLVLLDTAWWLLEAEDSARASVLRGIADALATRGARDVAIAAHHPFTSGGPHGGVAALEETLGIRALLSLSGAMLQDLHSRPYAALRRGLTELFAEHGPTALFAGGHEHSIQVLEGVEENEPARTLVSGAGSKLSPVGSAPGMLFARSEPGFARLLVTEDGRLYLSVATAPAPYLLCPEVEPDRVRCMREGERAFRTVWSEELTSTRPPAPARSRR